MTGLADIPAVAGYWYLGSPYTLFAAGLDEAHRLACEAAAALIAAGHAVYSPIAHSHPVAVHGRLDQLDHALWLPQCLPLLRPAAGLIVLTLDGWRNSHGLLWEIEWCWAQGRPVVEWVGPWA